MASSRKNPSRASAHGRIAAIAAAVLCGRWVFVAYSVLAPAAAASSTSRDSQAKARTIHPAPRSDSTAAPATTSITSNIGG